MYKSLGFTLVISFCIMYTVMFLNVDSMEHIYLSLTRAYMSLLMVSPMSVLMILSMGKMYPDKKQNALIIGISVFVFAVSLFALRTQLFITDQQYMRVMIPHHSSAIMTSKNAALKDPEDKKLSEQIIKSQEEEIAQMKQMLERLK